MTTCCYLSSPGNQLQAAALDGMPTLISFALYSAWIDKYVGSFSRILIDSGAYSELNSGKKIDGDAYKEWQSRWIGHADAIAGLDDIGGDWRRSMKNYTRFGGFPTIHDSDPRELLKELIPLARERGKWLGVGLMPPREGKEGFIRWVCDNVPQDIHLHGWALRRYAKIRRLDTFDSTNWFRDSFKYNKLYPWMTPAQAVQMVVWRYVQEPRTFEKLKSQSGGLGLMKGEV